jgi:hypothetical protein
MHLPPAARPAEILHRVSKGAKEPAGEFLVRGHFVRPPGEQDEDDLHGVFSQLAIAKLPERGGENPPGMTIHDGAERIIRFFTGIGLKQLLIAGRFGHSNSLRTTGPMSGIETIVTGIMTNDDLPKYLTRMPIHSSNGNTK